MKASPSVFYYFCIFVAITFFPSQTAAQNSTPASPKALALNSQAPDEETITRLLNTAHGLTPQEKLAYIALCKKTAAQYSTSPQIPKLYQRIGDIYYELDIPRYATKWKKWYRKAIALEPALKKETPIGYRLDTEYTRIALRRNLLHISYAGFLLMGILLVVRILPNLRSFAVRFFLIKTAVFTGIYVALAVAVLSLDLLFLPSTMGSINVEQLNMDPTHFPGALISTTAGVVLPLYPLGIHESPMRYAVFIIGLLPVLVAVFYISFRKAWNRWLLSAGIIVFSISLWLNFIVVCGTDAYNNSKMIVMKSRVLFRGIEPEELLIENPRRALRANPDMLKIKNSDLELFIEQNFPQGFPKND